VKHISSVALLIGPLCFVLFTWVWMPPGLTEAQSSVLGLLLWMGLWWIFEAIPLYATSLIPICVLPLVTELTLTDVTHAYGDPVIFLFLGGFILALGIEKTHLHQRFAAFVIRQFGPKPHKQLLSLMLTSTLLSMWVSNTATTLMILPLALALSTHMNLNRAAQGIMLVSVAYGASIGGMATLVGTPPNLIFAKLANDLTGTGYTFASWMAIGLPFSLMFLFLAYLYLRFHLARNIHSDAADAVESPPAILENFSGTRLSSKEIWMLVIFLLTALNWVFKADIPLGGFTLPGIATLLGLAAPFDDAIVAMVGAVLVFATPTRLNCREFILTWEDTRQLPWGVLILFGGGIALSMGLKETGLLAIVGTGFSQFSGMPTWLLILCVCLVVTFATEVMSNTALIQVMLPVLAAAGSALGVPPVLLMIPATLSASCAFMLPVATPPNSVVYASGKITIGEMAKLGFALNLIGAALLTLYARVILF
jgi:sodium-dependent dicarboxylate transporter 2/3/5